MVSLPLYQINSYTYVARGLGVVDTEVEVPCPSDGLWLLDGIHCTPGTPSGISWLELYIDLGYGRGYEDWMVRWDTVPASGGRFLLGRSYPYTERSTGFCSATLPSRALTYPDAIRVRVKSSQSDTTIGDIVVVYRRISRPDDITRTMYRDAEGYIIG